jgi:hypothetical protein
MGAKRAPENACQPLHPLPIFGSGRGGDLVTQHNDSWPMGRKIGLDFVRQKDAILRALSRSEFLRDEQAEIVFQSRERSCFGLEDVPGPKTGHRFARSRNLVNRLRYLDDSLQPPVAPILGWLYPRDPIASNQIPAEIMGGCTYVEG